MRIIYLRSALNDLAWFGKYYGAVFPQGRRRALERLRATEQLLIRNPALGSARTNDIREFPLTNIPFSIIYNVTPEAIEILHIWDQRRNPSELDV